MLRTFHPFSSPQIAPTLPSEPMKYPLAISLTVPANSALPLPSFCPSYPLQLSLQLMASGIHQHLVCSLPGKQLAKLIRNDRANNNPHRALFSALFGAIPSLVHIRMQLKRCWIFYGCELQISHLTDRYHCPEGLGTMASAHFLLCCSESGLSSCSNAKELLAHARRVRSPSRCLTLHREV